MNTTMEHAPAKQKAKKRPSKEVAFATSLSGTLRDLNRQLDLFADDPVGAEALLDIAAESQQAVKVALQENPALAAALTNPATAESVNFAHLMRTEGASVDETHMVLTDAGEDADAVMAHLAEIERVTGTPEAAQVAAVDEGMAADIESELSDLESDSDDSGAPAASVKKDKKAKAEDTAETAFKSLMSQIRGPKYAPLTVEQELALYTKIQQGETEAIRLAARNELCDHNMRFLVAAARRFSYTGRPLDVLVAYGTIGLISAAQKFDPTRGRFTTCAAVWIRQSIQRALGTDSIMKTPAYMPVKESRLRREAEASTDPEEKVRLAAAADELAGEIKARRAMHVSLDGGQDDDSDSGNMLSMFSSECAGPDELMERRQLITQLVKTAKRLGDDRETDIFLMRLGLHEDYVGEPKTLSEVSEIFDISRERVRQVYNGAAEEVAKALAFWANGAENLPEGFRKGLMSPGRC